MRGHVAAVVAELTLDQERAVFELCDYYGRGPGHLASAMGIMVPHARNILGELRRHGIADFGALFDEDCGLTRGRGYWLGTFGCAVRDQLELNSLRFRAVADLPLSLDDIERMNELERKEHCS